MANDAPRPEVDVETLIGRVETFTDSHSREDAKMLAENFIAALSANPLNRDLQKTAGDFISHCHRLAYDKGLSEFEAREKADVSGPLEELRTLLTSKEAVKNIHIEAAEAIAATLSN